MSLRPSGSQGVLHGAPPRHNPLMRAPLDRLILGPHGA